MFTLINADAEDDEDAEISSPEEIAELFAAIAAVMVESNGVANSRAMLDAVIDQRGAEVN